MKAFLRNQFRTFRTHGTLLLIILALVQMAVIGLMLLGSSNLREQYNEAIEDNVKLFMENYLLKQTPCDCGDAPEQQDSPEDAAPGFQKV
jgi:hypothetical protein